MYVHSTGVMEAIVGASVCSLTNDITCTVSSFVVGCFPSTRDTPVSSEMDATLILTISDSLDGTPVLCRCFACPGLILHLGSTSDDYFDIAQWLTTCY